MAVGVVGHPLFASRRAGTSAPAGVATVCFDLPLARHDQAEAFLARYSSLDGLISCSTRSELSRPVLAKPTRQSSILRSALFRLDSYAASLLSISSRADDESRTASASTANSSSRTRPALPPPSWPLDRRTPVAQDLEP